MRDSGIVEVRYVSARSVVVGRLKRGQRMIEVQVKGSPVATELVVVISLVIEMY